MTWYDNVAPLSSRTTAMKDITSITSQNLFVISGGPVRVLAMTGYVTTGIQVAENYCKLKFAPTGGEADDISGDVNLIGVALRNFIFLGFQNPDYSFHIGDYPGMAGLYFAAPLGLSPGVLSLAASATTTGAVSWYILYEPMAPGAMVTAA